LTDNHGHTVDFTNTIVVMTSNVGSQIIQRVTEEGGDLEEIRRAVTESLQARFLPEFLNRIDETIIFHTLLREQIRKIVDLQVTRLAKRLEENGLSLEVTDEARNRIAAEGYDPTYGARPLKRVIQHRLENPLATEILRGEYEEGTGIRIDWDDHDFVFSRDDSASTQSVAEPVSS
jgi:ATP-dependent Clp protease ATP-binding subunit ClpB